MDNITIINQMKGMIQHTENSRAVLNNQNQMGRGERGCDTDHVLSVVFS